ncbi:hypothetical protein LEMA_P024700.1 [Plenodomus lingam JN3]|uniref:Uncharacterized protein n=1 Tax=Leptosphaeria maculans (strain JN3 / isolate v23.1.3 / race Av1-4-5-6-7-8) TaxID=985895 RepID=E4ZXA8_LEPMJ|nr:hypothetical protein LEMA_P024700.1 [Plenodomus lingam JN3]CBX95318.1 hypothetical protein LEMA_P024700.1 [Plenodomus lingam JN3]
MSGPASTDDELLARLNALKKSSVSLDPSYSFSVATSDRTKATDDLAARFARHGSPSPSNSPQPSRTTSINNVAPVMAPGPSSYLEGIAQGVGGSDVEFNEEDEKTLQELLGELNGTVGDRKEWDISGKEQADVGRLLKDMKKILPEVVNSRIQEVAHGQAARSEGAKEELTDWESIEVNAAGGTVNAQKEDTDDEDDEDDKKKTEDDEAEDVIAKVMAELEISRKYDPPSPPSEDDDSRAQQNNSGADSSVGSLTLPSAPKDLADNDFERTQAFEDAFTARLAALSAPSPSQTDSLGLPSAPSFAPRKKPAFSSNLQERLDEEIDTWCIICQDDATLRCIGCDNDLYCQNCWMEGHKGESAGFEERRHKAVLFVKKKPQATLPCS